jgi:transposase
LRATTVTTTTRNRQRLEELARSHSVSSALRTRARIVLLAADGRRNVQIAAELGVSIANVATWRSRYARHGVAGLQDKPRSGRPRQVDRPLIIANTLAPPPPEVGYPRWTCRELARHVGVSEATVARVWREYGLSPRDDGCFNFTTQPGLAAKAVEVVGLRAAGTFRAAALLLEPEGAAGSDVLPTRDDRAVDSVGRDGSVAGLPGTDDRESAGAGDHLRFLDRLTYVSGARQIELVLDGARAYRQLKESGALVAFPKVRCQFALDSGSWLNLIQVWIQMMVRDGFASALEVGRHADALLVGRELTWFGCSAPDQGLAGAGAEAPAPVLLSRAGSLDRTPRPR